MAWAYSTQDEKHNILFAKPGEKRDFLGLKKYDGSV
jgi:hypothetical protein